MMKEEREFSNFIQQVSVRPGRLFTQLFFEIDKMHAFLSKHQIDPQPQDVNPFNHFDKISNDETASTPDW
jgi:hypothetical protein